MIVFHPMHRGMYAQYQVGGEKFNGYGPTTIAATCAALENAHLWSKRNDDCCPEPNSPPCETPGSPEPASDSATLFPM